VWAGDRRAGQAYEAVGATPSTLFGSAAPRQAWLSHGRQRLSPSAEEVVERSQVVLRVTQVVKGGDRAAGKLVREGAGEPRLEELVVVLVVLLCRTRTPSAARGVAFPLRGVQGAGDRGASPPGGCTWKRIPRLRLARKVGRRAGPSREAERRQRFSAEGDRGESRPARKQT
jgi:hypothetical protein